MVISTIYYTQNMDFRVRNIANKHLLLSGGNAFELNELGLTIWDLLEDKISSEKIVQEVNSQYDINEEIIKKDVHTYINFLKEINAIEECN
ncbi:PqqD family protein [Psychrobacillus sp. PGGUH221]|uniref:PqqD family protein n=1 Tax=Psychrobacillus sp. PGGUH221 TaxID=3020058 RepID=UPI0035C7683A